MQVSDEREWARKVSEAQNALNDERGIVDVSLYDFVRDSPEPIEVIEYGGELVTKQFTVTANVTKDDVEEERTMCFTIQKADLHGVPMPSGGRRRRDDGRDRRGPLDHHGHRQDQQRALRGSRSRRIVLTASSSSATSPGFE